MKLDSQDWESVNYISILKETIFGILENAWDQYHSLIEAKKNPDISECC